MSLIKRYSIGLPLLLVSLIIPLPVFALGGSEELWLTIYSVVFVAVFFALSFIPALIYLINKGKSKFWNIITNTLCCLGIVAALVASLFVFSGGGGFLLWFVTYILSILPLLWLLKKSVKAGWEYHY